MAAMLLGHWYLNSPSMQLAPLRMLVQVMACALLLRAVVSGAGLAQLVGAGSPLVSVQFGLLALRWLAGIVGALVTAWMSWQTLKIPNTQRRDRYFVRRRDVHVPWRIDCRATVVRNRFCFIV